MDKSIKYNMKFEDQVQIFGNPEERQDAYQAVFQDGGRGEMVLKDILQSMDFFRMSFNAQYSEQTAFNEGKKHTCRHIINLLTTTITKTKDD